MSEPLRWSTRDLVAFGAVAMENGRASAEYHMGMPAGEVFMRWLSVLLFYAIVYGLARSVWRVARRYEIRRREVEP